MTPRPKPTLVADNDSPPANEHRPDHAALIRDLFETRDCLADNLAVVDGLIADESRAWAKSKGLAFIRVEQLRREVSK